jgi:hypothetical protein
MESMREIFNSLDGNLIHKWDHYLEVYETWFSKSEVRKYIFLK